MRMPPDRELANHLVVRRAAHLQHRQTTLHLTEHFNIAQHRVGDKPSEHDARYATRSSISSG